MLEKKRNFSPYVFPNTYTLLSHRLIQYIKEVVDLKGPALPNEIYKIFFDGFSKIFMLGGIQITLCILLGMQPAQDS